VKRPGIGDGFLLVDKEKGWTSHDVVAKVRHLVGGKVEIYSLVFTDLAPSDYPEVSFDVVCSTGTYVRTLADDLARALGGRAHLTKLRRVRNGTLGVADAVSVDQIEEAAADGAVEPLVIDPATALSDIPGIEVESSYISGIRNGVAIPTAMLLNGGDGTIQGFVRLLADGVLLGVYRIDGPSAKPEVVTA
jgi:tRNA pseudouridine55 synthase